MEERIQRLEAEVARLARAVERLEAGAPSAQRPTAAAPVAPLREEEPPAPLPSLPGGGAGLLALLGRSVLALGGGFLFRALTDAHVLPAPAGVALGFGFSVLLCALADRAFARGNAPSAVFHAATSALIAYPLLWESAARLHLLSDALAAAALALYALGGLFVAARRSAQWLAWLTELATLVTAVGFLLFSDALGAVCAVLLVLFAAVLALTGLRGWRGLRWPLALVLVMLVLRLASTLGGTGDVDVGVGAGSAFALCLPAVMAAWLAVRRIAWNRAPGGFEWVLAPTGIGTGLYAALQIAGAPGAALCGAIALALALASYAAAFAGSSRSAAPPASAQFHALLGFGLALAASELLGGGAGAAVLWSALGLLAAVASARKPVAALAIQAPLWLWAGAVRSGLLRFLVDSFAGDGLAPFAALLLAGALSLACAVAAATLLFSRAARPASVDSGVRAAAGALVVLLLGALLAALGARWCGGDVGALATLRTAVLSAAALLLAGLGRASGARELVWLCYAALVMGGMKLVAQDLPNGRAGTLVLGFALYGLALIVAPRLARARGSEAPPRAGA